MTAVPNTKRRLATTDTAKTQEATVWTAAAASTTPAVMLAVLLTAATARAHDPPPTVDGHWPADKVAFEIHEDLEPTAEFADFAWRALLAGAWPADSANKGEPDVARQLGAGQPLTFDTWANVEELYLPDGARPRPWSDTGPGLPPGMPLSLPGAPPGGRPLLRVLGQANQMGFGFPTGPLIAQNGTYTWYETRINKKLYEHLRGTDTKPTSWLYLAKNLPAREAKAVDYPIGSLCIKAAWREFKLPGENALLDRYHTMEAYVRNPETGAWEIRTVGLVGLHLIARTDRRPAWLWFSFEHVDNLAVPAGAPAELTPTYNDPRGPQAAFDPLVNVLPPTSSDRGALPANRLPVQVVRASPRNARIEAVNRAYQTHAQVRSTVWRHYELIVAQWPRKRATNAAYPASAGFPYPDSAQSGERPIANSVLETFTYYQTKVSCMECHAGLKPYASGPLWFVGRRAVKTTPP